jgi:hypothetical protein
MDVSDDGMGALVHQLYEAVQSAPPSKEHTPLCGWAGLLDQFFRDGRRVKGQLTITAGCRTPAPPVLAKEHMNDYLIQ